MRWTDTIRIDAPPDVVWRLTTDVAGWPSITSTMREVERLDDGPIRVGSSARVHQPGQAPAVWTVTELDPDRRFVWRTMRMGTTMVATHLVEPDGEGCRNTLVLDLTGPGARILGQLIGRAASRALRTENAGFKRAAEAGPETGG